MTGEYSGERWKSARSTALDRDEHTCQRCGASRDIHAHHIIPVREFDSEEDAHYPANLIAVCARCHRSVEGEPQWPIGRIETEDGIYHISNLLALDTVSRLATGEAAPELVSKHLWLNERLCSACLRRVHTYTPSERNPFDSYHNALYRIVVRRTGLSEPASGAVPRGFSFCNSCLGSLRLKNYGPSERENIACRLADLLEEFGFHRLYTGSFDYNRLVEAISQDSVLLAFSAAFGRRRDSASNTRYLEMAFREAAKEYHGEDQWSHPSGLEMPDGFENYKQDGAVDIPDWYRNGESGPTSE